MDEVKVASNLTLLPWARVQFGRFVCIAVSIRTAGKRYIVLAERKRTENPQKTMNSNAVALLLFVALAVCIGDSAEIPPLPVQDDQNGASSSETQDSYLGVKLYKVERPCAMLGGLCVQTSECNHRTANSGLCPENAHLGVDCCYEVKPAKNLTCHEFRGACMDRCAQALQRPATDCTDEQTCCVLVG